MTTLPEVLVLSSVHAADDARIREKLIRTLSPLATVTYATRGPGPSDPGGIARWIELRGGRLRRILRAVTLLFSRKFSATVIHDPELIPGAILASLLARRRIVVDIHEHVPGQLLTKEWIPRPLRRPLSTGAAVLLRVAERVCTITLAEPGYHALFRSHHPVFANYPNALPEPAGSDGYIVYVGDVTEARGLTDLAAAVAQIDPPPQVKIVGSCPDELRNHLESHAGIELLGRRPHPEAMELMRRAQVGVSPLRDLPNYRYSLPTKVVEYLGTGIAVVATDLPGTRDVIGDLPGVMLVAPGDIDELREAIITALADPEIRAAARANAATVRATHQWPSATVAEFYRGVLAGG